MTNRKIDTFHVRCMMPIHLIGHFVRLGFDKADLIKGLSIDHDTLFDPDSWMPVEDWYRLMDNCVRLAPALTMSDWEAIGRDIRKSEASRLLRVVVRLFGARRAISMASQHVSRFNNYCRLTVTPISPGLVEVITWVEPSAEALSHGLFLRWTAGMMSALAVIEGLHPVQTRFVYDQASLENIITRFYKGRYHQEGHHIFFNGRKCATRIHLKTDDIYRSQNMAAQYEDNPPYNATLITEDVLDGSRCLLKKGDIYDAPAGRMFLQWQPRSFIRRWLSGLRNLFMFSSVSRQELLAQTQLADQRYFETEGLRLKEQALRLDLQAEIEHHKLTEKEKQRLEARLRQSQKMEAIGVLAGGIAHDFNNLLFPMVGYAEMLKEDIEPNSDLQEAIDEILGAALRAKELVKQILSFSRQTELELRVLKIQPILKEVIKLIKAGLPSTIAISCSIDPDCGAIMADATQVHQVAMNLMTNAFHSMQSGGGRLKVHLAEKHIQSELPALRLPNDRYVCLTVADTGTGMDAVTLERIFEPYFSTKKLGHGTGLGLSVVHGIVKSFGGEISVHSEVGKGSRFEVYFPRLSTHASEAPSHLYAMQAATGNEHILLVDDEAAITRMLSRMLSRLGYAVTVRISGIDALEAFRADPGKFDLVLTDLTMPNLTGDRLAAEIKRIDPTTPVILCTGFSEKVGHHDDNIPNVDRLIRKPIIRDQLAFAVRQVLDGDEAKPSRARHGSN